MSKQRSSLSALPPSTECQRRAPVPYRRSGSHLHMYYMVISTVSPRLLLPTMVLGMCAHIVFLPQILCIRLSADSNFFFCWCAFCFCRHLLHECINLGLYMNNMHDGFKRAGVSAVQDLCIHLVSSECGDSLQPVQRQILNAGQ